MAILAMIHGLEAHATSAPMVRSKLSESTAVLMMLAIAIALPIPVFGQESRTEQNEEAVAVAVERAAAWLLTRQDEEIGLFSMEVKDGRWPARPQGGRAIQMKVPRTGTAMTSLAMYGGLERMRWTGSGSGSKTRRRSWVRLGSLRGGRSLS